MKFQDFYGRRVAKWGRYQVELWWGHTGASVGSHRHPHIDSHIVLLGGQQLWGRNGKTKLVGWRQWGRVFHVGPWDRHCVSIVGRFAAFLVVEKWIDVEPTSASKDIVWT